MKTLAELSEILQSVVRDEIEVQTAQLKRRPDIQEADVNWARKAASNLVRDIVIRGILKDPMVCEILKGE